LDLVRISEGQSANLNWRFPRKEDIMISMSIEARLLLMDQDDGCTMTGYRNGAPRFVMPRPGGPIPRTKGQVSDAAAREVTVFRMADLIRRQR
jgi:hypothetical protein